VNLPEPEDNEQLVVQGPVGQGYVVAIASRSAFKDLPWYLRPYDEQAEELGYQHTEADDQSGVTAEGRIVGDPFVAMERIRRAVLMSPDDADQFSEAYTSYYVHSAVRYPRYPLLRLPPPGSVRVLGWFRSVLHDVLRVLVPRQRGVVLGADLLVRLRAALRVRRQRPLPAALSPARHSPVVLVVGRLDDVERTLGRTAPSLSLAAARRLRRARQVRGRPAVARRTRVAAGLHGQLAR
jgi:hypothetical protein